MTTVQPPVDSGQASAAETPAVLEYVSGGIFDPDHFRMTIGDHLDELRRRLIYAMLGVAVTGIVCFIFGQRILSILCKPLIDALQKADINPQLYTDELGDAFMTFLRVVMLAAVITASPWVLYQLWQFVAAGLYPHERKYVTRYLPLSVGLLIAGLVFVYFVVLPMTLTFFIHFTADVQLPLQHVRTSHAIATTQPSFVQVVMGNPPSPRPMQIWFDANESRLKLFTPEGTVRVIPFGPERLLSPTFKLPDYLDMVFQLLLTFALAFQMPIAVMAAARIGFVDVPKLKKWRRYMYFAMVVLAAVLAPGDLITATIALMVPLILLYELGIWLAALGARRDAAAEAAP